jgi:outer membrane protein TolC
MKFQCVGVFFALALVISGPARALTIQEYIDQVKDRNGNVKGTKMNAEAKDSRRFEASLVFKPSFFLNGEYADDKRPTTSPLFQGRETIRHTFRSGFSQNFRTGTKATLSYNINRTEIIGADRTFLAQNKFYDVYPMLELSQSLWRNYGGSEVKSTEESQIAQVDAARFNDLYSYKTILVNAENAYWRLYYAKASLKVQEESLERAKKLRSWNSNRVNNNLVDSTDLYQADANLQNRELELQDTLTEIDVASREFNSIRENDEPIVLEDNIDTEQYLTSAPPQKMKMREDVLAYLANQRLSIANAQLGNQRNKPNVELYGSYSMYGRDPQYSPASTDAFNNQGPFGTVGIRFQTPVDFGSMNDFRKAYAKEVVGADMQYKRKAFEVEREWDILTNRFENFKKRVKISRVLEKAQEKKLFTEKGRFNQGRTTTFQVLQFEQDFANAQLLRLKNERELITVYNQLKLFSGDDYEL